MAARRDVDTTSNAPTARFLQARITALSTSCIKRLENIFAAALDEEHSTFQGPLDSNDDAKPPPALTETAVKQLQLDVESSALIRATEDFMVLTRTLKELWLFGDLNTISQENEQDIGIRKQMEADEKAVVQSFLDLMTRFDSAKESTAGGTGIESHNNG